jgi:hypothetical protein
MEFPFLFDACLMPDRHSLPRRDCLVRYRIRM